jgi:hypothetical protein
VAAPEIACIADPDTGIGFEGGNVMTLSAGGFSLLNVKTTGVEAPYRLLVDGGTMALPELACLTDPNTGLAFAGSDLMSLVANGQEIARIWQNGANTQFASYANQTYIANQLWLGGSQAATSVSGVVRAYRVYDGSGNSLGWIPIYGAVG